jgi:hypothetical protein
VSTGVVPLSPLIMTSKVAPTVTLAGAAKVMFGVSGPAPAGSEKPKNSAATRASAAALVTASGHTPCVLPGTSPLLLSKVRVIIGRKEYFQ